MVNDYKLIVLPIASADIESICKYISIDLANPIATNKFVEELEDTFQRITVFPKMYPTVNNEFIKDQSLRKALVKSYIIFYKIDDKTIQVIRVLYSGSDYPTLLK